MTPIPDPALAPPVRRPADIPAPVERAAQAYLHMVPFCETCLGRSKRKLLIRRCAACKDLAYEFAWTMLVAAFEGRDLEDTVSTWWQQQAEDGASASQEEFSRSLAQTIRTAAVGADS